MRGIHEMEELKRVQDLRVDEFSRRRLIENQDTVNELTARIQELQHEVNCMNDPRDFQDVESLRSGQLSHVPSQPALCPSPRGDLGVCAKAATQASDLIFGIRMVYRETFSLVYLHLLRHLMQEC